MNVKEIRKQIYNKNRIVIRNVAWRTFESIQEESRSNSKKMDSSVNGRIYENTQKIVNLNVISAKWRIVDALFGESFFPN